MNIAQLFFNALAQGALYFLYALALALVLYPLRVFHAALGGVIALAGYVFVISVTKIGISIPLAFLAAMIICTVFGIILDRFVYRPLFIKGSSTLSVAISSFAVYLVVINLLAALFGSQQAVVSGGHSYFILGNIVLSSVQIIMIICAAIAFLFLHMGLKTKFGQALRALEDSPDLLRACGWNILSLRIGCIAISSTLVGMAGSLAALDTGIEPTMGMSGMINALVIVIVAGPGVYRGIFIGALALAILQQLIGFAISPRWEMAVSFCVLTGFLVFRPNGLFSSHKRVEEFV